MNVDRIVVLVLGLGVLLGIVSNVAYSRVMTIRTASPILACLGFAVALQVFMGDRYDGRLNSIALILTIAGLTLHLKDISRRVSERMSKTKH